MEVPLSKQEILRMIAAARIGDSDLLGVVQGGLDNALLVIPSPRTLPANTAGGSNLAPNSDLAWSEMAATTADITPDRAGATNLECHRFFRQKQGDDVDAQRLRTVEADPWVPLWDRVNGVALTGSATGHDAWDIAVEFTHNWLVGAAKWFLRAAIATVDATPLPAGTKIYMGLWVHNLDGSENWAGGSSFPLTFINHAPQGAAEFNYKVIAKTSLGFELESSVLNVPDAYGALDQDNYYGFSYFSVSGFSEFRLYKEDVPTGVVRLISTDSNSTNLRAYDTGQAGQIVSGGMPSVSDVPISYREVKIVAYPLEQQKTFHDVEMVIPSTFDTSVVSKTYMRLGVIGETAIDNQVVLDTLWAGKSKNIWSPAASDASFLSPIPSTTMTTASGSGGDIPTTGGGGGACLWEEHFALLCEEEFAWSQLKDCKVGERIEGDSGESQNSIRKFLDGEVEHAWEIEFSHGLKQIVSPDHRFSRDRDDTTGVAAADLKEGDTFYGGKVDKDGTYRFHVAAMRKTLRHGTWRVRGIKVQHSDATKLYATGDPETGAFIYNNNTKIILPDAG